MQIMNCKGVIREIMLKARDQDFKGNKWGERHFDGWHNPRESERGIRDAIVALAHIADAHFERYESPIGQDGVLGEGWLNIARGVCVLLNGELGRLDGGTLDRTVRALATAAGFTEAESDTL